MQRTKARKPERLPGSKRRPAQPHSEPRRPAGEQAITADLYEQIRDAIRDEENKVLTR